MSDPDVRELHDLSEFADVERLYAGIWPSIPGSGPVISVELMRALSYAGNYVAGAYHDGRLVGATVAFFAAPIGEVLHSHTTGAVAGSGVGFALKQHQRDWALARGLQRITWTYDPLIRRNAYFNLVKLGARPEEYLPSFYGEMLDTVNSGDDSDRALVVWYLDDPAVKAAARGEPATVSAPHEALLVERDGLPVVRDSDARTVLVGVPPDIETLRRTAPEVAKAWRTALRDVLGDLLAEGAEVVGFDRDAGYVVTRPS
jgi:predicted GNAT superfamily acetyltransferase